MKSEVAKRMEETMPKVISERVTAWADLLVLLRGRVWIVESIDGGGFFIDCHIGHTYYAIEYYSDDETVLLKKVGQQRSQVFGFSQKELLAFLTNELKNAR